MSMIPAIISLLDHSVHKKFPYSELFWFILSRFRTEYGEIRSTSPNSVKMRENANQNNSEYGHFSRRDCYYHESVISIDLKYLTVLFIIFSDEGLS